MARLLGFVGPTYALRSLSADAQRCVNWYPEVIESRTGKAPAMLSPTPGLKLFASLAGPSVRALHAFNGRLFATSGASFYEIDSTGAATIRGSVAVGSSLDSIVSGASHLLVISGDSPYYYTLATNTLTAITTLLGSPKLAGYSDGYFIVLLANSRQFQISALLDPATWDPLDTAILSVFPGNISSMIIDHREIAFIGEKQSVFYFNSGDADFPYDVRLESFMEQGGIGAFGVQKLDNSLLWVGLSERGGAIAWRAEGYRPQRISTHAIEQAWEGYGVKEDVRTWAYEQDGHNFWVVFFPTANATWVYDTAVGLWHERGKWNTITNSFDAHLGQCHAYCFGKHLVGDRASGNVYELDVNTYADNGEVLRRMRRGPHGGSENKWIYVKSFEIDAEVGLGPMPHLTDMAGNPRDPKMMLRSSKDGGKTWGNTFELDAGRAGEYKTRIRKLRLGRARDWVPEISVTDPIPWRIIDAYAEIELGTS